MDDFPYERVVEGDMCVFPTSECELVELKLWEENDAANSRRVQAMEMKMMLKLIK